MDIIEFNRWFLALFFAFVAVFYAVRITFLTKKTREIITPIGKPGTVHYSIEVLFRVFRALILLVCWVRLWWPPADDYIGTFPQLFVPSVLVAGDLVMVTAVAGILSINLYLKDVWRSGIPERGPFELITSGPYRFSRNPMMLFVMVAQFGFFLALPSYFSLLCFVLGVVTIVIQERLEGQALSDKFGDRYAIYCQRTPRWLLMR